VGPWNVPTAVALLDEVRDLDALGQGVRDGQPRLHALDPHPHDREYARHNGHADLIRESIDGAVGE